MTQNTPESPIYLGFASQKGGVGKSSLAETLASILYYEKGIPLLVVDCDGTQESFTITEQKSICPRQIGAFVFLSTPKTSDHLMKTKIGRGLLALLVCVQALAASNAYAWARNDRLFSLPLFERAVACIKHYEGLHGPKNYPYVGYGHRLLPSERLSCAMTKRQADSLLRADLKKRLVTFRHFGRDSLLLAVLSYNVGEYRLLGYGKQPKSRLVQKLESGDRDIRGEYTSFCRYRGKELKALRLRRRVELALLYEK